MEAELVNVPLGEPAFVDKTPARVLQRQRGGFHYSLGNDDFISDARFIPDTGETGTPPPAKRARVEMHEVRIDLGGPQPEQPADAPAEFNYFPYVLFGGILLLLAMITEDPRGSNL
jgi:hypothetical protein